MSNPTCYPKTALKHYMAGWTDADESSVIEAHLSECEVCEQTLAELEGDPETLLEFLQGNPQTTDKPSISDPLVSYALSKAKQLGTEPMDASSDAEAGLSAPPTTLGPYDLLRPIGQGSMGRVYLAKHRQLGKLVAVKVFASRAFRSNQYAIRFAREVRAAGALQHASIINATDAGQDDSVHYLVMEYIEGLDLSRLARAIGPLAIADACAIGHAMALGLDHAHAAGIVHRDIKPSNVMLSTSGQVKLLDFGLAQTTMWDEASAELTTVGQLMGTIDYMAPEQAERAESVDYRADLYALGATLFRLLCGRAPLAASPNLSPLARLRLLATSSPPALRTLRPDAPVELEKLIHQLLSRDPEARPASAAHVAEQLMQWSDVANLSALIRTAQQATPTTLDNSTTADALPPAMSLRSTQPPYRIGRWLKAAAAGAMALAAIILITLETQKGQVVIESVDANVTVQLSKDGQVQKSLTVVPGANSTRIAAGQYDVTISAGSDQFAMDRETLEIKRGETVIARVRQPPKPNPNASDTVSIPTVNEEDADAKVYEGKTLATWRKQLMRERSVEAINQAFAAIAALADAEDRLAIVQEFLLNFPTHFTDNDQIGALKNLLGLARESQSYIDSIAAVLSKVDEQTARQLLHWSLTALYQDRTELKRSPALEAPLAKWSADFLRSEAGRSEPPTTARRELLLTAGFCIVGYLEALTSSKSHSSESEQQWVDVLKSTKALDNQFWLSIVFEKSKPYSEALAVAVEERATSCFLEDEDPVAVSIATLQLSLLNELTFIQPGKKTLARRADIVEAIRQRLMEFVTKPERMSQFVEVERSSRLLIDNTKPHISRRLGIDVVITKGHRALTNPCLDLLDLADVLQANDQLDKVVSDLLDKLKHPLTGLAAMAAGVRGRISVQIEWPVLSATTNIASPLNMALPDSRPSVHVTIPVEQVMAMIIFSQLEKMLRPEMQASLAQALPQAEAVKQVWLEQQMKTYDLDGNGSLDGNELAFPRADADDNRSISREELQAFYDSVIENLNNRRQSGGGGGFGPEVRPKP